MQKYKSLFCLKSFITACLFFLSGCHVPSPKNRIHAFENTSATFTAVAVPERSKVLDTRVSGPFSLPSAKVFTFQVCVRDVAYNRAISGHEFLIVEQNKKSTSDKSGCFNWSEDFKFNFLADSQYVRIERTIRGTGLHKGDQHLAFAINPWTHGELLPPVINPDDGTKAEHITNDVQLTEKALKGFSGDQSITQRRIWAEDMRLTISEQKLNTSNVELTFDLRPHPAIQLKKMNGEVYLHNLVTGTFKARIKLIHTYIEHDKEIHRLLSESSLTDAKIENGNMAIRSTLSLPVIPTRGQLMLGLELQSINGPEGLLPFEGVYYLGEYDQLKGTFYLRMNPSINQNENFKISDYINSQFEPSQIESKTDAPEVYQKPKIEIAPLEFRFLRVGSEKTSSREVIFNVKACLKNGIDQKVTRGHSFVIQKFKQTEADSSTSESIKTDNNACLNWEESISFKFFDCQHYIKGFFNIKNDDLGMNEKLEVLLNPWDSLGLVGRDMRYVDNKENIPLSCQKSEKPQTQLVMDGFGFNTLSYTYDIDSSLNLIVKKKIQIKMEPRLLYYSSLWNGRADVERLRDGVYLLKVAIVQNKDYDTTNQYVTSAVKMVNVLAGQINTDLTFHVRDLKALGNRNNLLIEIKPVDESKVKVQDGIIVTKDGSIDLNSVIDSSAGLESKTFVGPFTINIDEGYRPLKILDADAISSYFIDGKKESPGEKMTSIDDIIKEGLRIQSEQIKHHREHGEKRQFVIDNNMDLINLKTSPEQDPLIKNVIGKSQLDSRYQVTKKELAQIINTGNLPVPVAQKLCAFWISDYFPKMFPSKGGATKKSHRAFLVDCFNKVIKNQQDFFKTEKKWFVSEVTESKYLKGFNQGITVGTSFSLSKSSNRNSSVSVGTKFGLSKKFLDLFSIAGDVGYTMSWTESDSNSNSISMNGSESLTVQQNTFQIKLSKHERCVAIHLNPSLFIKDQKFWFPKTDYLEMLNDKLSEQEKASAVTRGLMICEGEFSHEPTEINETYYLIAQESNSTQMQDNGDARNRNFFIALRSKNDFLRFATGIKSKFNKPESAGAEEDGQDGPVSMMEKLFQLPDPSYPGIYHPPPQ